MRWFGACVPAMVSDGFAYDGPHSPPMEACMRKKLLQHTLSAAIAAWALSMAHGPITADSHLAQASVSTQSWSLR